MSKRKQSLASDATPNKIRHLNNDAPDVTSPQLTVIVGQGKRSQTFHIHENLAKRHSGFFAAALKNGWKEAEEHVVRLPDGQPEDFTHFLRFAYYGKLYTSPAKRADESREAWFPNFAKEFFTLLFGWFLGDLLGAVDFKDALLDAIADLMVQEQTYPCNLPCEVYQETAGNNGLRLLAVDVAIWDWEQMSLRTVRGRRKKHG